MIMRDFKPKHFNWRMAGDVAVFTFNRPERKKPVTFDSYAELSETFRRLAHADDVKAVVFGSNEDNFCSGGDVHDIIAWAVFSEVSGAEA